jgi:hypothetical protein
MEGIRLAGTFGVYREAAEADVVDDGENGIVNVNAGDSVFVSFVSSPLSSPNFHLHILTSHPTGRRIP